jgi:CheY-like chemotaxis protein
MKTLLSGTFSSINDLMPHRIREVLLVSSLYDAFILEEDGYLTERIFAEYKDLNLTSSPRVTHVATAEEAFATMEARRFDMVITMMRLADMDVVSFARRVKELRPGHPVVMLALDEAELEGMPANLDPSLDGVFLWTGDASILLAIIKIIEDRKNIDHDIETAGVRVIIVVEDTIRYYSKFLGVLYYAILEQAQSLIGEGFNDAQRIHRLRARPKVLLASDYDQALALFNKYQDNAVAVISDIRYPRAGKRDSEAGYLLTQVIRSKNPDLPVLLQSADPVNAQRAADLQAHFVDKRAANLLQELKTFLIHGLGFGDFVFRGANGVEIARAKDVSEMSRVMPWVDAGSLRYHAEHNHISTWLMARCEFELARQIRPKAPEDFGDIEDMRRYLIQLFRQGQRQHRQGVIAEFFASSFQSDSPFTRMGEGSIGGKARGIAFLDALLHRGKLYKRFADFPIRVPPTLVICTDVFDRFLESNRLREFALTTSDEDAIAERFLNARLPSDIVGDLRVALQQFTQPLAVRSSSLLEDSTSEPFAGVYSTYMLPNQHDALEVRLQELCTAIKMVYASTFSDNARAYMRRTSHRLEEEKMAVIVQQLIGRRHGERFYPHFAGVAQTINHYPVGHQRPEDGVALVALGLGRTVVGGGEALRFSPANPEILPQLASPKAALSNSQRTFWALNLSPDRSSELMQGGEESTLKRCTLADAEMDGTLGLVASVYCPGDDVIRDGLNYRGPRLVTFANVLKNDVIPLAPALKNLLQIGRRGMGRDIQVEFAVDMGDWGRPTSRRRNKRPRRRPALYALQMRPMALNERGIQLRFHDVPREQVFCDTIQCLGSGVIDDIYDIIYVPHETFDASRTQEMAQQVGVFNKKLAAANRPYMLMGPGRWGSSDPWLGIPVQWSQINGARVIVEASPPGYHVDPSQGSHFFQNITSLRIGYLTVPPENPRASLDWAWLEEQPAIEETAYLRHVRLEDPLYMKLDGRAPRAVIYKQEPEEEQE